MNHHINNKYVATGISSYNDSFWKEVRCALLRAEGQIQQGR